MWNWPALADAENFPDLCTGSNFRPNLVSLSGVQKRRPIEYFWAEVVPLFNVGWQPSFKLATCFLNFLNPRLQKKEKALSDPCQEDLLICWFEAPIIGFVLGFGAVPNPVSRDKAFAWVFLGF